jgi:hypothetical protein
VRAGPLAAAAGEVDVGVVDGLRRSAGGQEREFGRPARPYAASTNAERRSMPAMRLPPGFAAGLEIGASVEVDGVCLTVTSHPAPDAATVDVMQQSLALTARADLAVDSPANVERVAKDGARRGAPRDDRCHPGRGGVGRQGGALATARPCRGAGLPRGSGAEMRSHPGP